MTRLRAPMTKRKAPPSKPGRYDPGVIAKQIRRERERQAAEGVPEREPKAFAARVGIGKWSYYKKEAGEVPFDVEEIGRIADELDAPPAWPFGDWATLKARLGSKTNH